MYKKILVGALILLALSGLAIWQLKPSLKNYVENILESKGLLNVEIDIASIGLNSATVNEIRFGENEPLILKDIKLNYSLDDLKQKRLNEITMKNTTLKIVQQKEGWEISGFTGMKTEGSNTNPLAVFDTNPDHLEKLPFEHLAIDNSVMLIISEFGRVQIPLNIDWQKNRDPALIYSGQKIDFLSDTMAISAIDPAMTLSWNDSAWAGDWSTSTITTPPSLPPFTAQGTLGASAANIIIDGAFKSSDNVYDGDFNFTYSPVNNPAMALKSTIKINVPLENGHIKIPLAINWIPEQPIKAKGSNGSLLWEQGEMLINAEKVNVDIAHINGQLKGDWGIKAISVTAPMPVPLLTSSGTVTMAGNAIEINGSLTSADKKWHSDFALKLGTAKAGLRVKNTTIPWKKGRISIKDISLPFAGNAPIKLNIRVEKVDLAELMSALTGNRITAQGLVSGRVPLAISRDGKITVGSGSLGAIGPGTIIMPPETIPSNDGKVNLVKDIMKNLHYEILNITAAPDEKGNLAVKMAVEGNNPDVQNGHPVKLNINLTGNLLDFLEQNIMMFSKPEKLIEGHSNAKKK